MADIRLRWTRHQLECPHCGKRTQHSSPGTKLLLGQAKCEHCGKEFLIVHNRAWPGDNGSNQRPA